MQKFASVFCVVCLCTLSFWVTGCLTSDQHPADNYPEPFFGQLLQGDSLVSPVPQQVAKRTFENPVSVISALYAVTPEQATAEISEDMILESPVYGSIDQGGEHLYLMETSTMRVNKYALSNGQLVSVMTAAQEYRKASNYIANIKVMPNDEVWMYGAGPREILRVSPEDEILGVIETAGNDNTILMESGLQVKTNSLNERELFHIYTADGEKESSFGILSSERYEINGIEMVGHGLGFAGWTSTNGDDSFIYVGNWGGGMISFNIDGSLRFFRESLVPAPFPGSIPSGDRDNTMSVDMEGVKEQHMALNVWHNVYYEYIFDLEEGGRFVDAYSYVTGDYLYSIPNPDDCWIYFITDSAIYANCEAQGFVQFEREIKPGSDDLLSENLRQ